MSPLGAWIVGVSLSACFALSIYRFVRSRNGVAFAMQLALCAAAFAALYVFFGFAAPSGENKGPFSWSEALPIAGLYASMLFGMLAHYLYDRFSRPVAQRKSFDFGMFIAPVFLSPIVFIPLYETLRVSHTGAQAVFMEWLVAFENGFFFKSYADRSRLPRKSK